MGVSAMLRSLAAAWALVAVFAGAPASVAQDLPIAAFAGQFAGTGLARNDLSEYFDLTVRDLGVTIAVRGQGFTLTWTTVLRDRGDPDNPTARRKSTTLDFVASGRAGVFRGATPSDPMSGQPYAWARIKGQTLTVHSLVISADGSYEMHTYDRTLTPFGMDLKFTRVSDGEPTRSVTAKLTKEAN